MEKKVVLFIPDLGPGGAERVFVNLAGSLAQKKLDVTLLTGTLKNAAYLEELSSSVRVEELARRHMRSALPALVRYLRRERPAVLIAGRDHGTLVAILAARLACAGTRVVATIHNTTSQLQRSSRSLRAKFAIYAMTKFLPLADEIVAVSHGAADDLAQTAGISRNRIHVVYNPVLNPTVFQAAEEPLDHPWFQEGQPPVVLGVGRLTIQKDCPNLIRSFAIVRKVREARLVILGEGEERPALERLVRSLGLDDDVALPGVVVNPFAYMKRSALFALSSAWEGLPTVLVEAMACGCPVVATDCPSGPGEILQGGRLGRLVPIRDEAALAEAMLAGLRGECPNNATKADLIPYTNEVAADAYMRIMFGEPRVELS